ncbi:hypothetical protein BDQ17DRAFT_1433510 [Cyathus striatus]|nr:hypothetical protein BDQ17DRAFT_1433510 [Cyathus striatus]
MSTRRIPPPPQTQALNTATFTPPPLDGSITLVEMFEWHLTHSKDHRLFLFAKDDGEIRTIYWEEAVRAFHVGARMVREMLRNEKDGCVVALLAPSDTITYFCTIMAIMRANHTPFPISPRNSAPAVAHLISKVNVKLILLGGDKGMLSLADETVQVLKDNHSSTLIPDISPIPVFEDLFTGEIPDMSDFPITRRGPDEVVTYLHSSGSTAFPKPIPWTNYRYCQLSLIPYFGEQDMTDVVWSIHTMPMYHGIGVFQTCWTASSGSVMAAFEPRSPAVIPTPDGLFKAAVATQSDIILCVPSFIEAWSRNPDYVKWLATRNGVLFGGGPLNKAAGDYMTSQGVSIYILYGSTEGGIMSPVVPAKVGYDWDYFKFPGNVLPEMIPYGNNTYELVMVSNPFCIPSVLNKKVNGIDSYATSDLFTPHPEKPGYWKIYGRTDDQIMHNTGEKTNPSPLENILNQDHHVLASVMFGRGHFQAGVLIDPKPEFKFDPDDEKALEQFRNLIWPTVQRMNELAPQHSRLFKEMILVATPSKPFQYTAKSTARRQSIIIEYSKEIEELYETVEASTQSNILPPIQWDIVSTTAFVRLVVNKVLIHGVSDDDDIFQNGCDSLQATWIRNSLLRVLRDSAHLDTRNSPENFVYNNPTITGLSQYIVGLACGKPSEAENDYHRDQASEMRAMVEKYSHDFPTHKPQTGSISNGTTVLLTGTTGVLGCYILVVLVADKSISHIYALNRHRKGTSDIHERQKLALLERGLDPEAILASRKVDIIEADLSVRGFGIPSHDYNRIQDTVTHIIHNAWTVDFNLSLTSFENNIKGLRNLVDLALLSPHENPVKFMYSSSIGVFQNISEEKMRQPIREDTDLQPEMATGNGYTKSKWISEKILANIAKMTNLRPLVVRVGQLSGGVNGCWNLHEWFPAVVHSTSVLQCIPDEDKMVSWIPVNIAARAMVDFLSSDFNSYRTVHLTHPKPISWHIIAQAISRQLSIPTVPLSEWFTKLEELLNVKAHKNNHNVELLQDVPALRLLPFLRKLVMVDLHSREAMGFPELGNVLAVSMSPTLSDPSIGILGDSDVRSWIGYWRGKGLLKEC